MIAEHAKGVFFDLYGTLLRYGDMDRAWGDWLTAFHGELRRHGLTLSRDEFSTHCDGLMEEEEPPARDDGFSIFERRIDRLCRRLGLDLVPAAVTGVADHIAGVWERQVDLAPRTTSILRRLGERFVLGLVSNFDHPPHVRRVLDRHGLTGFFRTIVISGEVGVKKPDPRVFEPALREAGLRPSEVVYVGDTEDDVAAAVAAGITPVMIRHDADAGPPTVDPGVACVTGLEQLLDLLPPTAGSPPGF